jgi:hypothetical protein
MANKACLDSLERPVYVGDRYLSLPWMTPGTTSFVLGYGYETLRTFGQNMEKGGVGGSSKTSILPPLLYRYKQQKVSMAPGSLDIYRQESIALHSKYFRVHLLSPAKSTNEFKLSK